MSEESRFRDNEMCNQNYETVFERFDRLANKIIWNETTLENLRELARQADNLASMIEEYEKE